MQLSHVSAYEPAWPFDMQSNFLNQVHLLHVTKHVYLSDIPQLAAMLLQQACNLLHPVDTAAPCVHDLQLLLLTATTLAAQRNKRTALYRDGVGTMISTDFYEGIRQASQMDLEAIEGLLRPLAQAGVTKARSRESLLQDLHSFTVLERESEVTTFCQEAAPAVSDNTILRLK